MKHVSLSVEIYCPHKQWDSTENYLLAILKKLNPSAMQTWIRHCDTYFSMPQRSETGHMKNLYLQHRDTCVAGKTGLSTFPKHGLTDGKII